MVESKSRFARLSEDSNLVLADIKDAKSTRATKSALKDFHQYLEEKKADERYMYLYTCERAIAVLCRSSKSG